MNDNEYINSSIPVQLANLTSLYILELAKCSLRGLIPYLPKLKELDVSGNIYLNSEVSRLLNRVGLNYKSFISHTLILMQTDRFRVQFQTRRY